MAQYAYSGKFFLPTSKEDLQPQKIFLAPPGLHPPGLEAPPGFHSEFLGLAARPGFQPPCIAFPSWQAPASFDAHVDICANNFSPMNLDNQYSMHMSEYQSMNWIDSWTLAEQDFWDELYETCTAAVLGHENDNRHGQSASPSCPTKCRSETDLSEETDSTVDTVGGADHEKMVDEATVDLFSNSLLAGGEEQQNALDGIIEELQTLCKTQQGSLLVQSALLLATGSQLDALSAKLGSFLIDACKSPHGNHVVQKCIDVLGHEKTQFIVDAVQDKAVALSRDRFACRIMQHLVDVCPEEQVSALVDEMMEDAARLCRHPFANYVMQSVVKVGSPARRAQIADVLILDAPGFSRHRFAKHVFQLVVVHGEPADQMRLVVASKRPLDCFLK